MVVLTVRGHHSSTAGETLNTMDQHDPVIRQGLVYEGACLWKVNKEVGIVHVLNWDAQVADPRCGVVSRYGLRSDRHDMGDTAFGKSARRLSRLDPGRSKVRRRVDDQLSGTNLKNDGEARTFRGTICLR